MGGTGNGKEINALIGWGTHGFVYECDGRVVKVSAVGELRYIRNEVTALRALGNECDNIPKLESIGIVQYQIRQTHAKVPAFMFLPKGEAIGSGHPWSAAALASMWKDVFAALTFAHGVGVYHLDVCPRNIIYSKDRYILIDWGCAGFKDENVQGFRGSLPFAHADIHKRGNNDLWKPQPNHDIASLLFTLCALTLGQSVPWEGFCKRVCDDSVFESRRSQTMTSLKTVALNGLGENANTSAQRTSKRLKTKSQNKLSEAIREA